MDMRQLATFRLVARTLSFSRTAVALNYVQSTVSAQIQALEAELNVQLFDRLGKRVALTDAGHRLLEYAEKILSLADEAHNAVTSYEEPAGTLTISATESLCIYRLPAVLREFRTRYPKVRLLFQPSTFAELHRRVSDGELDMAFVLAESLLATGLVAEPLIDEDILVVAPCDHPLATAERVVPADLEGEMAVLTEAGCDYRNLFERSLNAAGVRLATVLEFTSVEAIKQCVMAGLGVAVLPRFVVTNELQQGQIAALRWTEPDTRMITQMVWHKDKWHSPALTAFLKTARQVLQPIGAPESLEVTG